MKGTDLYTENEYVYIWYYLKGYFFKYMFFWGVD